MKGRTVSYASGYALDGDDDDFDPIIDDFVSKERKYLHFDLPLSEADRTGFQISPSEIETHSFWPLIGYVSEERKVKKDKKGNLQFSVKQRPIKFGSHRDAAVLEYYTGLLSKDFENLIAANGSAPSVLAYRSGVGNNINHSKALFDEIRRRGDCIAIALDIEGFFNNIRHDVLYRSLQTVCGVGRLSKSDFKIFERMTRFEWVESHAVKQCLGKKYGRFGRICRSDEFRRLVRKANLVQQNPNEFGIPQGTPLSGLYANISLMEFDRQIIEFVKMLNGSYRRYSDDLAIVVPAGSDFSQIIDTVRSKLYQIGLDISTKKTEVSHFQMTGGQQKADKPFQYLGFTFDGRRVLIRQSSLNRYYSKMNRGVSAKVRAAKKQSIPSNEIFMRELFRKFTHFGRNRNFPRYAYRACKVHGAPEIREQLRSHMTIFKDTVRRAIIKIY